VNHPNIALIGQMGTGKSTIAAALGEFGYTRFSWAAAVRAVAKLAYGEVSKNQVYEVMVNGRPTARTGREILQRIGTDALRDQVDEDFWIRSGLRAIEKLPAPLVNDDTRFENEAETLSRAGWVIVRVQVPDEIRHHRLTALYGKDLDKVLSHPSETTVDKIPYHYGLWNTAEPQAVAQTLLHQLAEVTTAGGYHRS
jgi:dephospho-CoA kinase